MVGLIIAIVSERAREDLYVRAFSEVSVKIPFAPSSGEKKLGIKSSLLLVIATLFL